MTQSDDMPNFSEMKKALDSYEEKIRKDKALLTEQEKELKKKKDRMEADVATKELQSRIRIENERKENMMKLEECRAELEDERKYWDEEKERVKQTKVFEKVITLNVGGTRYTTTLSTLTKYPDSMLGAMFSGRHDLPQQEDGSYFIDRDGEVFKYILMYLRDPTIAFIHVAQQAETQQRLLKLEANYFLLPKLEEILQRDLNFRAVAKENELSKSIAEKASRDGKSSSGRLCFHMVLLPRRYFELDYKIICKNPNYDAEYRHEEMRELEKCCLKLKYVEFKEHVVFRNCDLSGAELRCCIFQKPASFEGSILRDAVFENVSGLVTHRVHFTPRQVAQAKFQPELLDALRANGCIY